MRVRGKLEEGFFCQRKFPFKSAMTFEQTWRFFANAFGDSFILSSDIYHYIGPFFFKFEQQSYERVKSVPCKMISGKERCENDDGFRNYCPVLTT